MLDRLDDSVDVFGVRFSPSKCKMLLRNWISSMPNLVLEREQLGAEDRYSYLACCISPGCRTSDGVCSHTRKSRMVFANLRHLWRRCNIGLLIIGRVCMTSMSAVLFRGSASWPLSAENTRRFFMFGRHSLRSIGRIWWENFTSNS